MAVAINLYATVDDLKTRLGLSGTSSDALLLDLLEAASRAIDDDCHRHFFSETATRYFAGSKSAYLLLPDDLLSVTTLAADSGGDRTWTGETWTEGTDFQMWPDGVWPKTQLRELGDYGGSYSWSADAEYLKLVGVWGYGDGERAAPWDATPITATVATAGGTALTLSAAGTVEVGHTLRIGTEQMFVSAVATVASVTTATVQRGVNGTTAAAHTAAAVFTAAYPPRIRQAAMVLSARYYRQAGSELFESEGMGQYRYKRFSSAAESDRDRFMWFPYRRVRLS